MFVYVFILGVLSGQIDGFGGNRVVNPPMKQKHVSTCGGLQATSWQLLDGLPNGKLCLAYSLKWGPPAEWHFWAIKPYCPLFARFTDVAGKEVGLQTVMITPSVPFLSGDPEPWNTVVILDPPENAKFVSVRLDGSDLVVKQIPIVRADRLVRQKRHAGELSSEWSDLFLKARQILSDMMLHTQSSPIPRSSP